MPTPPQETVPVWDLPTRVFHWVLVAAVTVATVTGYVAPEWCMGVHLWAGYVIVFLLVFRLVWGVFGSEYSRIASFAYRPRQTADITTFLTANAAETWDTEAANRFRTVAADAPGRISATPYWVWKHQDIPDGVFFRPSIGGKSACNACHRDADSGRFDDQMITIPKG